MHSHSEMIHNDRCPLCDAAVDRRILQKGELLEASVVKSLRAHHPRWRKSMGACFRCVAWALSDLLATENVSKTGAADGGVVPDGIGRRREILSLQTRLAPDLHFAGRGVTVAIVDSDFVYHPDFLKPNNRIVSYVDASGASAKENAHPPNPYLGSWHGTMVAGAGFGSGFSAGGRFPGLAPEARLVFVRIGNDRVRIGENEVLRGLRWVLNNHEKYNIRIVNLSVGGDAPAPSRENKLDRLAARAVKAGIVVIAAAGNRPDRKPIAPASCEEVITVGGVNDLGGAVDGEKILVFPGSHGPTLDLLQKPDVLAPAIWVPAPMVPATPQAREAELLYDLESLPDPLLAGEITKRFADLSLPADIILRSPAEIRREIVERARQQKFITPFHQHVDGTSFAAAIVSAAAAQMLEANPKLTPRDVKNILRETAAPLPGIAPEIQGAGVIRPALAVRVALEHRAGRIPNISSPAIDRDAVHYFYFDPTEKLTNVEWLGVLNGWKPQPMKPVHGGLWTAERPRPTPGVYAYKYLLSDGRFVCDPANDLREGDGFGGWNSLLDTRA